MLSSGSEVQIQNYRYSNEWQIHCMSHGRNDGIVRELKVEPKNSYLTTF
jgi:hypothetical protein